MFQFLRKRARKRPNAATLAVTLWSLQQSLFKLSKKDDVTIGNAVENVLIVGGIGSGKTSASGRTLALAYLKAGFGGLILCAKPEEPLLWRRYAELAGRLDDLVEFGPQSHWRFDPLAFELSRAGVGAGHTENLVQLFSALLDLGEKDGGRGGGKEGEQFWRKAFLQLLRNLVDLLVLSTGKISVPELYRLAISTASSLDQVRNPEWRSRSYNFLCLTEADKRPKTPSQQRDMELVADYFLIEWPNLSEKTRSVVLSTFTSMADVLNRGILRDLFTEGSNIDPTAIEQGKIIVVAMSLKEYGQIGLYAAALWKYAFQKSIERRDVTKSPRPVVLWQDEGQFFLLPATDFLFTSTSRSARVSDVLLTQSISGVVATLGGGPSGKAEADAYLSNYGTKIFHANTDPTSNEYAANLIGRCKQFVISANNNYGSNEGWSGFPSNQQTGGSSGINEIVEFELQPREFSKLRTGGTANRGQVDAIVFKNGAGFKATGRNWMKVTFTQDFRSS
jgi:hypothetical protein